MKVNKVFCFFFLLLVILIYYYSRIINIIAPIIIIIMVAIIILVIKSNLFYATVVTVFTMFYLQKKRNHTLSNFTPFSAILGPTLYQVIKYASAITAKVSFQNIVTDFDGKLGNTLLHLNQQISRHISI